MTPLNRLKIKLDIKDKAQDGLLKVLLLEAQEYILAYTRRNKEQWLKEFEGAQVQIAVINYGRQGMEGVVSRREGEITTEFLGVQDYPASVTKTLDRYRLIKGL